MSQHDMNIANQGFPSFRSDLNDALGALVSSSSGATEPSTTFAHQFWMDTAADPSILKVRNADNDAWITLGTFNQTADTFTPAGASSDKIEEGNSKVEVVDTGTGYIVFEVDGTEIARLTETTFVVDGITVGQGAGNVSTNTAVGVSALAANEAGGTNNTAIGYQALDANTTGDNNVGVGDSALGANTTGIRNTAVGSSALSLNTSGTENTALGRQALQKNTTASSNVAVGQDTLRENTTGATNTGIGTSALQANTVASNNTAVGYQAGYSTQGGANLTFVGVQAGYATTGGPNDAFGFQALTANTSGTNNVALGYRSLYSNTTGPYNTAVGHASLGSNTTAADNTAVGRIALTACTTGERNTAVGSNSGSALTTGSNNVFLGKDAGAALTSGVTNILIGRVSAQSLTTGSYNIHIGYATTASAAGRDNALVICSGPNGATDKGANTGFINPNTGGVFQGDNSSSWSTTSDQRLKKNIVDNTEGLDKINAIQVRNFEYRLPEEVDPELQPTDAINKSGVQLGVIAQELQQVCPDCVKEQSTGVLSVNTDEIFWHMVNAIKELSAQVTALQAEVNALKGQ